jgi:diguanylate cyclase (GGDEF)-like protein/PAS domain S-box-containing protein
MMKPERPVEEELAEKIKELTEEITWLREREVVRIHTEEARFKIKANAFAFFNATSDLAVLLNMQGIILEVNEAAVRRVGKKVGELTGKCIFDFFSPEFTSFRKVYINIVQQTKEPLRYQDEYEGMILHVCIYPICDSDGEVERLAVFVNDNTEIKRNEDLLYSYSQIISTIQDPVAYIDKNFIFRIVNDPYQYIYQKPKKEIIDHTVEEIFGKDFIEKKIKWNIQKCLTGQIVQQQEWFDFPDGKRRFMYLNYYPMFAKEKQITTGVVLNSIDITKIKELEEELKRLSVTDQLTQLYNRLKFHQALEEEIKRQRRYKTDLTAIMFDIDHFKRINDTYGHDVGDKILVGLVNLVHQCIRETDVFSRWGGEEFMLLLPHTSLENAIKLAERIRIKVMENPFEVVGAVTCSFGVSELLSEDTDETFCKRLDEALYESKRSGRNRVTVK